MGGFFISLGWSHFIPRADILDDIIFSLHSADNGGIRMSFKGAKKPFLWGHTRYCHRVLVSVRACRAPNDIYMEMYNDNSLKTGIHSHYIIVVKRQTKILSCLLACKQNYFYTCSIFTFYLQNPFTCYCIVDYIFYNPTYKFFWKLFFKLKHILSSHKYTSSKEATVQQFYCSNALTSDLNSVILSMPLKMSTLKILVKIRSICPTVGLTVWPTALKALYIKMQV